MKLALGTVQFGLDYGVNNEHGQVEQQQVARILSLAKSEGVSLLDTAYAYGESETTLGLSPQSLHFDIVSKIPAMQVASIESNEPQAIAEFVKQSLKRLKRNSLYGLLFHDANDLLQQNSGEYFKQLTELKNLAKVTKIGVSVYTPEQAIKVSQRFDIDLIQLPLNCLDQRFLENDLLSKLHKKNIEIHCRSAFLQGLLLMSEDSRPVYFDAFTKPLNAFATLCQKHQCSPLTMALAFLLHNQNATAIDKIVVGCCSVEQLEQILNAYREAERLTMAPQDFMPLACDDVALINPANWQI